MAFSKNAVAQRLALSLSPENDARIAGLHVDAELERAHRMAMNPEQTIRQESGIGR